MNGLGFDMVYIVECCCRAKMGRAGCEWAWPLLTEAGLPKMRVFLEAGLLIDFRRRLRKSILRDG